DDHRDRTGDEVHLDVLAQLEDAVDGPAGDDDGVGVGSVRLGDGGGAEAEGGGSAGRATEVDRCVLRTTPVVVLKAVGVEADLGVARAGVGIEERRDVALLGDAQGEGGRGGRRARAPTTTPTGPAPGERARSSSTAGTDEPEP